MAIGTHLGPWDAHSCKSYARGEVRTTLLHKAVQASESVDDILICEHLNESYLAVLSCGAFYCAV